MKGLLLDVDSGGKEGYIRLLVRANGKTRFYEDASFKPYFYVDSAKKPEHALVEKAVEVERELNGEKKRVYQVFCSKPSDVPRAAEELAAYGEVFEQKIPFHRRYCVDKGLKPCGGVEFDEGVKNVRRCEAEFDASLLSFDIETYNKRGGSEADRDPAIIIGYAAPEKSGTLSYGKGGSEKRMLEEFSAFVEKEDPDLLLTYNGDGFDVPYLKERARRGKAKYSLSRDGKPAAIRSFGARQSARVSGRVHFDVYNAVYFLNYIGAIKSPRLKLETVYENVFNKEKKDLDKKLIWELWEKGDKRVFEYCESDAKACLELGERFLAMQVELAKVSGLPLFDSSRATAGQLVEALLMRESFKRGLLLPNKPAYSQVRSRLANPIQGAFVKMPEPGVYENVVVFDFRSLYPSIIVSHNVDLATLDESAKSNESPAGHRFSLKKKGLIPSVLKEVLEKRYALKDAMKKAKGAERERLHARQWALKILANSFYGYMVYSRSRWYSREAGESITAWARHYIKDTIRKADEAGFNVIYSDTDSVMMQCPSDEKALEFQEKINGSLPAGMELELEDFYPRGIFVSKKHGDEGAKKKYALINREGKIKIRGFELVRRDWSKVARETQREVLETLLKEGDVDKAVKAVKKVVEELKSGSVPLEDLVITTQLRKKVKDYAVRSPEVHAVKHARKHGVRIEENAVVGYVITQKGKSISDKAVVAELAKDYDADYYVEKQVLPSVLKILGALGYDEEDIKTGGKQTGLGAWK